MLEYYWISGSAPSWRVLLALEYKGVAYQSRILETSQKEQKSDWFLAINPRGQVPVLKDGDMVIRQSLAILHYLERHTPAPPLFGEGQSANAAILQAVYEHQACIDPPINEIVQAVFRNKVEEHRDALTKAAEKAKRELAQVDATLAKHDWMAGSGFSAADAVMIPTFQRILRCLQKQPALGEELQLHNWAQEFPHVAAWNARAEALPFFDKTFPPHWK